MGHATHARKGQSTQGHEVKQVCFAKISEDILFFDIAIRSCWVAKCFATSPLYLALNLQS